MNVPKIQRETVADKTTAGLRQSILTSEIPQGTPVTEEAMAEQLGVSRTTMRQAVNTLLMEGLLTRHPTTRIVQVTTLSRADVSDIYRARRLLELGGIDAAANATPEQRAVLSQAVADLRSATSGDDPAGFVMADFQCHAAVVALLGSRLLSEAHTSALSRLRIVISQITSNEQDNQESLLAHEEFIERILSGHLDEAKVQLAGRLDASEAAVLRHLDSVQ